MAAMHRNSNMPKVCDDPLANWFVRMTRSIQERLASVADRTRRTHIRAFRRRANLFVAERTAQHVPPLPVARRQLPDPIWSATSNSEPSSETTLNS